MNNLELVLIAGLFTIVGAAVGGVISRYGLPSWGGVTAIYASGSGREYRAIQKDFRGVEEIILYDYSFHQVSLQIFRNSVKGCGGLTIRKNGIVAASGKIRFRGPIQNGYAFCSYKVQDSLSSKHWRGSLILYVPSFGEKIKGLWLTEDAEQIGGLALGTVEFSR